MTTGPDDPTTNETGARDEPSASELPASLVPRWLALLVLLALLAAAGYSVHAVLTAEPPRQEETRPR